MSLIEINFDGIVGPSHNYAGLSAGNLASATNAGKVSHPRTAALQGIDKMRGNIALGLTQGILLPHPRPDRAWLAALGHDGSDPIEPHIRAAGLSASAMWAANAATVSPAPDTRDGLCHLTVANLMTMPHRAHEAHETLRQLRLLFANPAFAIHGPVPAPFGDEGAANHMRLCPSHGETGVEVFVYGVRGGPFPARQHIEASQAVARLNQVNAPIFVAQSEAAIAAGAFHNDVVAVANERVLLTHEHAFENKDAFYASLTARLPAVEIIEVPASAVSLEAAIASYLFNAQLVTLGDGAMALIVPGEAQENAAVRRWLEQLVMGNGPIRKFVTADIRESMANGGGPACLRLRVVADQKAVDPRFMVDEAKLDAIAGIVTRYWPGNIEPGELARRSLIADIEKARDALFAYLEIPAGR